MRTENTVCTLPFFDQDSNKLRFSEMSPRDILAMNCNLFVA